MCTVECLHKAWKRGLQENRPIGTWTTTSLPPNRGTGALRNGLGYWILGRPNRTRCVHLGTSQRGRAHLHRPGHERQANPPHWRGTPRVRCSLFGQASGSIDFFSIPAIGSTRCATSSKATSSAISPSSAWQFLMPSMRTSCRHHRLWRSRHSPARTRRPRHVVPGRPTGPEAVPRHHRPRRKLRHLDRRGVFEAPVDHPFELTGRLEPLGRHSARNGDYAHVEFAPNGHILLHRKTGEATAPDELWLRRDGLWEPFEASESVQVLAIASGSISE